MWQLLEAAGLKDDLENKIWAFFESHIVKAICHYQVEQQESDESVENIESSLKMAVDGLPTKKVRGY